MTAYIKLSTSEYPRHAGDIQIDPAGMEDYAHVEWVDPPDIDFVAQRRFEGAPFLDNGVWYMTWLVRDATPAELEFEAAKQTTTNLPGSTPDVVG